MRNQTDAFATTQTHNAEALRILFLCNSHVWGGAEAYVGVVAGALAAHGHHCWIASPPGSPLFAAASALDGVAALPFDMGPKLGHRTVADFVMHSRRYRTRIRELLVECQYAHGIDVLHVQFKKEQMLATAVAERLGIPVVWTEHGPLPTPLARLFPARSLYRRSARIPQCILCVSDVVSTDLREHGVPASSLVVCYNGIDVKEPADSAAGMRVRDEFGIPAGARVVGMLARLARTKGHDLLLAGAPEIVRRVPKAWFLFAGDGPTRDRLHHQADRLGVGKRVVFAGHRNDVPAMLAAMDVVASPSRTEGHPFSVLEAMAAKVPVVGTRVGGIPEALGHGQAGVVVPPDDVRALSREIASLLESPTRCATLGLAGRRRVLAHFTTDLMMRSTENVFNAAAHRAPGHAATRAPVAVG